MLSLHSGRICLNAQQALSVSVGLLWLLENSGWKSFTLKWIFSTGSRQTHSLVDSSFSPSEKTAVYKTSTIRCPVAHGGTATRRPLKVSQTLQDFKPCNNKSPGFDPEVFSVSLALIKCETANAKLYQAAEHTHHRGSVYKRVCVCCVYTTST